MPIKIKIVNKQYVLVFIFIWLFASPALLAKTRDNNTDEINYSQFPKVPYPKENQHTEAKRVLGKILFWDEQLSTDNSIACGTCHIPSASGTDRRIANNPGYDNTINTKDDIIGSLGVISRNNKGQITPHPIFGNKPQVTGRTAQPYFLGLWANSNFWDGRAQSQFIDPQTSKIAIREGGALENQALGPLMSAIEMAKVGQTPQEVTLKLQQAKPLALANNFPVDIAQTLFKHTTYPTLFKSAFGDESITLKRIAFAIATYERSLIADETPWDAMIQHNVSLPYLQNLGWEFFKQNECTNCHIPPLFTDNKFYNVGIQGQNADIGHKLISGQDNDIGTMKTPSLRNVGLKTTFMHTGNFSSLDEVIDAYAEVPYKNIASKLPNGDEYNFQFTEMQRKAIIAFLELSLTDLRVKKETFPFDRPVLRSETAKIEVNLNQTVNFKRVNIELNTNDFPEIDWIIHNTVNATNNVSKSNKGTLTSSSLTNGFDIEIVRNDGRHFWSTTSPFIDLTTEKNTSYSYTLFIREPSLTRQTSITTNTVTTSSSLIIPLILFVIFCSLIITLIIRRAIKYKTS